MTMPAHRAVRRDTAVVEDFLIAAALQQPYKIRYYIERIGLHPDTTREGKPTALGYAALKPNLGLITYYLERGADVNHADAMGMTPLHYAAMGGCAACLACLVSGGADINRRNRGGETPLASALYRARRRSQRCVELLRCYGAVTAEHPGPAPASPRFH